MEMGPGAPIPISFVYVERNASAERASFLETGPGAPVPLNFFLVNSSLTRGEEKDEKDAKNPPATSKLSGEQPAAPERPVNVMVNATPGAEDIPRPIQRHMEDMTQKLAASVPTPTSHEIFLAVLGIGSVVFIVILLFVMRCVYDALHSAYEGARASPRPNLLSSLTDDGVLLEKARETLLRMPETAR